MTDPDGMKTKYIYADADGVNNDGDASTDEGGEWSGQLVKVVVDYGTGKLNLTQVEYEYDNTHNRMTKQKDALGNATTYAYNDAGTLKSVTHPEGLYVAYTYDDNGQKTREEKRNGVGGAHFAMSEWDYDVWGHVTEERGSRERIRAEVVRRSSTIRTISGCHPEPHLLRRRGICPCGMACLVRERADPSRPEEKALRMTFGRGPRVRGATAESEPESEPEA